MTFTCRYTELPKEHFAYGLIENMVIKKIEERITPNEVLEILKNRIISKREIVIGSSLSKLYLFYLKMFSDIENSFWCRSIQSNREVISSNIGLVQK